MFEFQEASLQVNGREDIVRVCGGRKRLCLAELAGGGFQQKKTCQDPPPQKRCMVGHFHLLGEQQRECKNEAMTKMLTHSMPSYNFIHASRPPKENVRDHEENCSKVRDFLSSPGEHHRGMFRPKYLYAWINAHMKGKESDGEKQRPIQGN